MENNTNGKLLLVEDDKELRETLEEIFEIHDFSFDVAKNVTEAKQCVKLEERPYTLVLSDYLMPGESGLDFFKFLKQEVVYTEIPFYILTARTEDEVRSKCVEAGVSDFFEKPFKMQTLVDLVNSHLMSK